MDKKMESPMHYHTVQDLPQTYVVIIIHQG